RGEGRGQLRLERGDPFRAQRREVGEEVGAHARTLRLLREGEDGGTGTAGRQDRDGRGQESARARHGRERRRSRGGKPAPARGTLRIRKGPPARSSGPGRRRARAPRAATALRRVTGHGQRIGRRAAPRTLPAPDRGKGRSALVPVVVLVVVPPALPVLRRA